MIKRQLYTFFALLGFFLWILFAPSYLWKIFATLVFGTLAGVLFLIKDVLKVDKKTFKAILALPTLFHFFLFEELLKRLVIREIRLQGLGILPFVEWEVKHMSFPKLLKLLETLHERVEPKGLIWCPRDEKGFDDRRECLACKFYVNKECIWEEELERKILVFEREIPD